MINTCTFRTNIKCNGCKSKAANVLDNNSAIESWDVNLESDDKLLTVKSSDLKKEDIIALVNEAGYTAAAME